MESVNLQHQYAFLSTGASAGPERPSNAAGNGLHAPSNLSRLLASTSCPPPSFVLSSLIARLLWTHGRGRGGLYGTGAGSQGLLWR